MRTLSLLCSVGILSAIATGASAGPAGSATESHDALVERGEYLVAIGGCHDCHTPGHFYGQEDWKQMLAGGDVGFTDRFKGVVVAPNLTPDKETGLGLWTDKQIAEAITMGRLPDGKILSPIMPWPSLSRLTESDTRAVVAYLRSIKPVSRKTPGPFPLGTPAAVAVLRLTPPASGAATR